MGEEKNCPYCGETILEAAKKCRYCDEWLEQVADRSGSQTGQSGSPEARAVTKGLKQKEYHDQISGCLGFVALIIAASIGTLFDSWLLGIGLFVVAMVFMANWYYRE